MSKTKKNGIPYDDAVTKMGADAMRWLYCQQKPPANVSFGYNIADQVKREFILILWNSYRFFTQHANLENWQPSSDEFHVTEVNDIMDKWILSRLHTTIQKVSSTLDKYSTSAATKAVEEFVSDLSTWYIRRNRDRSDNFALLKYVFTQLSILIAPFTPFLSEILYQNLIGEGIATSKTTIHTQDWPLANDKLISIDLEAQMAKVRQICQLIHGERQKSALKIRQPLAKVIVSTNIKLDDQLINVIAAETNIKQVVLNPGTSVPQIELDTTLTPELIAEGEYRDLVRSVQVLRREAGLDIKDRIKIFAPGWPVSMEKDILSKTLADSIEKSAELRVEKIS